MASFNLGEKPLSPAQGGVDGSNVVSDVTPAVPLSVILKLLGFTFAMIVVPLGSFFFTREYVFNGSAIYSGAFAALMANVVLIGYVIVAVLEDQGDQKAVQETKKDQ
ncbi:hypothetical protein DV735_g5064, partial [Chaetothyriales sp. CBS 134920]